MKNCRECGDIEKLRITERLRQAKNRLTRRARPYDKTFTWLHNAEEQHATRPFRAIITSKNPDNQEHLIVAKERHDGQALWQVDTEQAIPRNGESMAACAEELFRQSKVILFVDPHFQLVKRFTETLEQFIKVAHKDGKRFRRIEYHTLQAKEHGTDEWFQDECHKWLARMLPSGTKIKVVRWKEREPGEKFHARYVLTDMGGLNFETGLDSGKPGETTDVRLLDDVLYRRRWDMFQSATAAFDYVDDLTITCTDGSCQAISSPYFSTKHRTQ